MNGGCKEEEFDRVGSPLYSPDGKSIAYWAQDNEKTFMVRNGQRGKQCDAGSWRRPAWSPDGRTLAYVARRWPKELLMVDGQERGEFDEIRNLTFSPDGRKLAFGARVGRAIWWKVIDVR